MSEFKEGLSQTSIIEVDYENREERLKFLDRYLDPLQEKEAKLVRANRGPWLSHRLKKGELAYTDVIRGTVALATPDNLMHTIPSVAEDMAGNMLVGVKDGEIGEVLLAGGFGIDALRALQKVKNLVGKKVKKVKMVIPKDNESVAVGVDPGRGVIEYMILSGRSLKQ